MIVARGVSVLSLLLAVLLAACGGARRSGSFFKSDVLVVPASFEVNLETARYCVYEGSVSNAYDAKTLGANVLVAFVYSAQTYVNNGVTQLSFRRARGKAVRCPDEIVAKLEQSLGELKP